ncbi:MAG: choice-of-anchor J domain-containing protein [Sphingobacteriales bacterium]|nr:choice-of-anchor J domain-containing protein [Sphingobacteriales bacterium]
MLRLLPILVSFLLLGCLSTPVMAQQVNYSDDFSDGNLDGYTLFNIDGLTPDDPDLATMADSAWTVKTITAQGYTGGNAAFAVSWYVGDVGPSDDWLITPAITVGTGGTLSWKALAITSSGIYRDRYQVFVADAPTLDAFSFTAPLFDTSDSGEVATPIMRTLDLSAYAGQTIYVGFRDYTLPYNPPTSVGGNELIIDDITVTSTAVGFQQTSLNLTNLSVSPNPATNGIVKIDFATATVDNYFLEVLDVSGKIVYRQQLGNLTIGTHQYNLNLDQLVAGNYMLHLLGSQQNVCTKLIVK